jgi:hypothetical protein
MDSMTVKSRPAAVARSNALRDPVTVREAVDTELDPSKAVNAAGDGGARHDNASQDHHESSQREVVIDPDARDALFQAIDVRAAHEEQSPNQVLIGQRAYRQAAPAQSSLAPPSDPHADIEA